MNMNGNRGGFIRILVVDDSGLVCKILSDFLNKDPQLMVVGIAKNGKEAVDLVPKLKPDLVTMDVNMPEMDGFEATKQIMAYHPVPILILSSSTFKSGSERVFKSLEYGALDVFEKSVFENKDSMQDIRPELIDRIKMLARIKVISHPSARIQAHVMPKLVSAPPENGVKIIAMAASTGGPQALMNVLKPLPKNFPCPILIVQHISPGFSEGLVEWLKNECAIRVCLAEDCMKIQPSTVYMAPTEVHMIVGSEGILRLNHEAPFDGHKPSGNVLFESVAKIYGNHAIGVVLTGMGSDGALGARQIHQAGGMILAQDEATSLIFGMPKTVIEMKIADEILPLQEISDELVRIVQGKKERMHQ